MTARAIDGLAIAKAIQDELKIEIDKFTKKHTQPCLAVILVGNDPASQIYVRKKQEACEVVGIKSELHAHVNNQYDLTDELDILNRSRSVSGILVQLPLPPDFRPEEVFPQIHPYKDVDVFNPYNVGLLVQGTPRFLPCTPHAVQQMLHRSGLSVAGKKVVVINRSNVVGKPLSSMLIQEDPEYADATVTVCHDATPPETLKEICSTSDIIVVAVGIPGFLKSDMVKPGAVVIDVGISRVENKIVGDVDKGVWDVAGWISKTPGGVGPCTVACLLKNTLLAARLQHE